MRKIKTYIKHYFNLLLFYILGWFESDPSLWVFHGKFEGNTKFLFLWLSLYRPDIRPVWVGISRKFVTAVRSTGEAAYYYPSFSAFRILARGRYHFVGGNGTTMPFRSSKSFLVSLWHGSGIKKIGLHQPAFQGSLYLKGIHRPHIFVAGSRQHAQRFAESFRVPISHCPVLGTPRLDGVLDGMLAEKARSASDADGSLNKAGFQHLYLYAPTWRETWGSFLEEAVPDPKRLGTALAQRNDVLYIKLHPLTLLSKQESEALSGIIAADIRIRIWPSNAELYSNLDLVDYLITDYSSIFADFVNIKEGGLILYPFDLERYRATRGFHMPYEMIDGVRADDFLSLCALIETGTAPESEASSFRQMRADFSSGTSGLSSIKIVDFVEDLDQITRPGLAPLV